MIDLETEEAAPVLESKLERSKARRREAIIGAARSLLRETGNRETGDHETGETGLSMRALAARAGVSLATPYNLFGSKQAVLVQLLNSDAAAFGKVFQSQASTNKLSRIFEFVDMSFNLYRSDPEYFRVLLRTLYRSEDADLRTKLRRPRAKFLKTLVRDAVIAGHLEADLSVDLVAGQLFGVYLYGVQEWAHATVSLERARLDTGFGYSLVLLGEAAEHAKPELLDRRNRLRSALEATVESSKPEQPAALTPQSGR